MKPTEQLLRDALELILPLAKGYAHAHPVGSNEAYIKNATDLLAATSQQAEGEPVEYQYRTRPMWEQPGRGWTQWGRCSAGSYADYAKSPIVNDWEWEVRALYAAPLPVQPQGQGAEKDAIDRIDELCDLCAEAYQVVGVLAAEAGRFDDPQVIKVLDNLSAQKMEHTDCLPFMCAPPSQAPEPAQARNFCPDCGKRQSGGIHTCSPQYAVEKADAAQQEAAGAKTFKVPRTPQEAVDFIGADFAGRDERGEMENWLFTLSVHDLLSAFSWWEDMWPDASLPSPAPQAGEPISVQEALKQVLQEMRDMSPQELRKALDECAGGELAKALACKPLDNSDTGRK